MRREELSALQSVDMEPTSPIPTSPSLLKSPFACCPMKDGSAKARATARTGYRRKRLNRRRVVHGRSRPVDRGCAARSAPASSFAGLGPPLIWSPTYRTCPP